MFFLIKLIMILALLSGVFVYGGTIWDGVKDRIAGFTDPELQRANILDSFKNNFSEIEKIIKQVNENSDNPEFDQKAKIEEALKIIEESKGGLEEIEKKESEPTFIEKTFENIRDAKDGVQSLFTEDKSSSSQNPEECKCSLED